MSIENYAVIGEKECARKTANTRYEGSFQQLPPFCKRGPILEKNLNERFINQSETTKISVYAHTVLNWIE